MPERIQMALFDQGAGLAGHLMGQRVLGEIIAKAPHPTQPTPIFLDFEGVTATASFVRTCVLGFRDHARKHQPNLYPIVANASTVVLEELIIVLANRGDALAVCEVGHDGSIRNARVIGQLELRQQQTLEAIQEVGEADAVSLFKRSPAADTVRSPTVWNNRLASLVAKGLLFEVSRGRVKTYRCVLPELKYGN